MAMPMPELTITCPSCPDCSGRMHATTCDVESCSAVLFKCGMCERGLLQSEDVCVEYPHCEKCGQVCCLDANNYVTWDATIVRVLCTSGECGVSFEANIIEIWAVPCRDIVK